MATINELLTEARELGLELHDTQFHVRASALAHFPEQIVGSELRAVRVIYSGDYRLASAGPGTEEPLMVPADKRIAALGERLLKACQSEGACLWFGNDQAGVGCHHFYESPAARRYGNLAEDIRVTRLRALERPGIGHEERLERLTQSATAP